MNQIILRVFLILIPLFLPACGGDGDDPPPEVLSTSSTWGEMKWGEGTWGE